MTTAVKEQVRYGDGADVGDILVAKWGYDQTNATWFRVERRTEKSVWLVELAGRCTGETGFMQGNEVPTDKVVGRYLPPVYNEETGEVTQTTDKTPFRKSVKHATWDGGDGKVYVRMSSYMFAHPWSGKPEWTSWYA